MYKTKNVIGGGSASARKFWETRVKEEEEVIAEGNCSPVWSDIYCTIKDRKRHSQSHTSSLSASRSATPTPSSVSSDCTTPSPSTLSRTTSRTMLEDLLPSPPRHPEMVPGPTRSKSEDILSARRTSITARRFQTTCFLQPKAVPVRFSSTIVIQLGSTRRKYTEQVDFQTRLVAQRFSETTRAKLEKVYSASLTIPCEVPIFISLESQQINGSAKMTNGGNMILTKEEFL